MKIIVGLGNPGKKYQKTRHNVGFMTIDNLQLTIDQFSDWRNIKKLQSEISEGEISGQKIILAKPQIFMNLSGKAVKTLVNFHKITSPGLVVIHDDIDIPLGEIKISKGRGPAGHKGVESIIKELGTPHQTLRVGTGQAKNFVRFRIGIQPKTGKPENVSEFVLQKFSRDEKKILKEVIKKTVEAIEMMIKEGAEKAMSKYNR